MDPPIYQLINHLFSHSSLTQSVNLSVQPFTFCMETQMSRESKNYCTTNDNNLLDRFHKNSFKTKRANHEIFSF